MSEAKQTGLAKFLQAVKLIRSTGGGVDETSYYGALEALFNEAGRTLKPHVFCVLMLADRGEGSLQGYRVEKIRLGEEEPRDFSSSTPTELEPASLHFSTRASFFCPVEHYRDVSRSRISHL